MGNKKRREKIYISDIVHYGEGEDDEPFVYRGELEDFIKEKKIKIS